MHNLDYLRISGIHAHAREPQQPKEEMNLIVTTTQKPVKNTRI